MSEIEPSLESSADEPELSRQTSLHVRQARQGDDESFVWLVEKFSPLLLASARYNLADPLRSLYDPEDLVNDVWLVVHRRLDRLEPREGRLTPVLLRYLTSTLNNKIQTLSKKHIWGKPKREPSAGTDSRPDAIDRLEGRVTGVLTRLVQRETGDVITQCLEQLAPEDREIVILRGIEQHRYKELAVILGTEPNTLAKRYSRALARLRENLPGSVFEEFVEE